MCARLFWARFKLIHLGTAELLPKMTTEVDFVHVCPVMNFPSDLNFLRDKYAALYQVLTILIRQRKNTGWLKCFLYPS